MKGTILLSYNENTRQVEDEEKSRFLRGFLEQCFENAPEVTTQISDIWNIDGLLPASQKVKLRQILTKYGVIVIDDLDGHLKIYVEDELMAEWHKSTYFLKRDYSQKDRKKQIYIEMCVECWSVFEEQDEQKDNN